MMVFLIKSYQKEALKPFFKILNQLLIQMIKYENVMIFLDSILLYKNYIKIKFSKNEKLMKNKMKRNNIIN